jgi:hypothetical protein
MLRQMVRNGAPEHLTARCSVPRPGGIQWNDIYAINGVPKQESPPAPF